MQLFKYVGPGAVPQVFANRDKIAVRFGWPREYNDPYELYLQPSEPLEDDDLSAFYDFFLGQVAQAPVACFSRRPDSVVMWAHYGREGTGICLAFDEDEFADQFPVVAASDVEYSPEPATISSATIQHAFMTGKRRHTLWLLAEANRQAYFMKRQDWQYEHERRLVVPPNAVEERDKLLIGHVAPSVLNAIIVGPNVDTATRTICEKRAQEYGIPLIEFRAGLRRFTPFFMEGSTTKLWDGNAFVIPDQVCSECKEPADKLTDGLCRWCSISDAARHRGPRRTMLYATLAEGLDPGLPFAFAGIEYKGYDTSED